MWYFFCNFRSEFLKLCNFLYKNRTAKDFFGGSIFIKGLLLSHFSIFDFIFVAIV